MSDQSAGQPVGKMPHSPETQSKPSATADRVVGAALVGSLGAFIAGEIAWAEQAAAGAIFVAAVIGYVAIAAIVWLLFDYPRFTRVSLGLACIVCFGIYGVALFFTKQFQLTSALKTLLVLAFGILIGVNWIRYRDEG